MQIRANQSAQYVLAAEKNLPSGLLDLSLHGSQIEGQVDDS